MSSLINLVLVITVIAHVQCAVIRIQEIPVRDDLVMKVVVKEGDGKSPRIASIKIDLEEKEPEYEEPPLYRGHDKTHETSEETTPPTHHRHSKPEEPSSEETIPPHHHKSSKRGPPVNNLPPRKHVGEFEDTDNSTPSDDFIPDFSNRHGIGTSNCPTGKVRRGPLCI